MKRKNKAVRFSAKIQEMPEEQVQLHIGADRLQAIRDEDPHPLFIGLDVGYEGVSGGEVMGKGTQEKHWQEPQVKELARKLNGPDVGLFDQHKKPGSSRAQVGEVVSGFSAEEDSLIHAYGVAYVKDAPTREKIQRGDLDICSVEADVVFELGEDDTWVVAQVDKCTGVMIGNGKFQRPGFRKAGIVAVIQELEDNEKEGEEMNLIDLMKDSTPDQIRAALPAGMAPSQLFTQTQLQADAGVQGITQKVQGELDTAQKELTEVKTEMGTLKKDAAVGKAQPEIAKQINAINGLDEKEKAHVQSQVAAQDFSASEDVGKSVGEAIAVQIKAVSDLRQLYGKEAVVKDAPAEKDDRKEDDEEKAADEKVASSKEDSFLHNNAATKEGDLVES